MFNEKIKAEINLRISKIQNQLNEDEALLVSSNANLIYTTGRVINGYVYIPKNNAPVFFVRRPVELTGNDVEYIRKPEDIPALLQNKNIPPVKNLLLECDSISYNECVRLGKALQTDSFKNGSPILRNARLTKTDFEIDLVKKSGIKHAALYKRITSLYREGMTDIEFSIEIERESRLLGSLGHVRINGSSMEIYMGSVLVGDNADIPSPYDFAMGGEGLDPSLPISCNGSMIQPGMAVMVDMGGNFTGYMTDMTRVFALGTLPPLAHKAHDTALKIQHMVEQEAKPGVAVADLYNKAIEITQETGTEAYFMGHKQKAGFIGHGIGIELNEGPVFAPRSKEVLEAGMVFALEPKFVIPHVGAVGVENSYVVTPNGIEKITLLDENIISLD